MIFNNIRSTEQAPPFYLSATDMNYNLPIGATIYNYPMTSVQRSRDEFMVNYAIKFDGTKTTQVCYFTDIV